MCRHDWRTPIESFNGDKPDVSYFRVFGTRAYVWIPPEQKQDKLSPKSEEMTFIGYEPNIKGYCFWLKERRQVFVSTNAIFDEKVFPYCSRDKADGHIVPLFLSKMKNCSQHLTTHYRTIIESTGIQNPLEISMSPYL